MNIVDMGEVHVPQIARIEQLCFSDPWTVEQIDAQRTGPGHVFLAAAENDQVAGYISLMYVLDEGYIGNVAVAPAFRRRGLGRALVEAMITRARGLKLSFLTLEVRQSNFPARRLYAGCGFRDVGLRRKYYEKPREDAVLMTLELEYETENPESAGAADAV